MKKVLTIIKDNLITGALIVIPLAVIGVILADLIKKIIVITTPLTEKMVVDKPVLQAIVATIIIVLVLSSILIIIGLILKTYLGKSFRNWLEKKIYAHIPFYNTFLGVAHQITGEEKENYPVVEVDLYGNNTKVLGLLTETLPDGRHVVYTPFSPIINIGQLHIVAKENVKVLDISLKQATEMITKIGFEAGKVYKVK